MPKFYVTFSQKYSDNSHPKLPEAHPDGYLTVHAKDVNSAHSKVQERLGDKYAFIYSEESFVADQYPKGEIASI